MGRKRKKKTSNEDWQYPWDPDAKIAEMKDGRTHPLNHPCTSATGIGAPAVPVNSTFSGDE